MGHFYVQFCLGGELGTEGRSLYLKTILYVHLPYQTCYFMHRVGSFVYNADNVKNEQNKIMRN